MSIPTGRHLHRIVAALVLVAALGLGAGCERDEVRSYSVDKPDTPAPPVAPHGGTVTPVDRTTPTASGASRMLGAVIETEKANWYFKLVGPAEAIAAQAEPFENLVRSLRFTGDAEKPLEFGFVPEGWSQLPASGMRFATFVISDTPGLSVTVFRFGPNSGSLKENVDRWRGQIGLAPTTGDELAESTRTVNANGTEVTIVDITGPGGGGGATTQRPPRPAPEVPPLLARPEGPAANDGDAKDPIGYALPDGWSKMTRLPPMAALAFETEQGGQKLVTTVTKLSGQAGGVEANLARWARQVGGNVESAAIEVDGNEGVFAIIAGEKEMILGVITSHGESSWFFKMKGPIDPVAGQKANFDAFIKSVRFGGGG